MDRFNSGLPRITDKQWSLCLLLPTSQKFTEGFCKKWGCYTLHPLHQHAPDLRACDYIYALWAYESSIHSCYLYISFYLPVAIDWNHNQRPGRCNKRDWIKCWKKVAQETTEIPPVSVQEITDDHSWDCCRCKDVSNCEVDYEHIAAVASVLLLIYAQDVDNHWISRNSDEEDDNATEY